MSKLQRWCEAPGFSHFVWQIVSHFIGQQVSSCGHLHDPAPCIPTNFHLHFMMTDILQNWFVTMAKKPIFFPPKVKVKLYYRRWICLRCPMVISNSDVNNSTFQFHFCMPFQRNKVVWYDKETCQCRCIRYQAIFLIIFHINFV